jgi:6-phosphogluconate dehydrogenase (decarboxylating)
MELGFVGLGKMGMNIVKRLRRGQGSYAERLLAALRNEFGGHAVVENRE